MKRHLALAFVVAAWTQSSEASVIDFEDIAAPVGGNFIEPSEASGGFLFSSPPGHIHRTNQAIGFGDSGSTNLTIHGDGNGLTMTQFGGGAFRINSVFLSEGFSGLGAATVHVVGSISGGGTVTTDFTLDGLFDSVGGVNDFQLFSFSSAWTNLSSVAFNGVGGAPTEHGWSIDNIGVNEAPPTPTVPEPTSLTLLALGLAGVGFGRRKLAKTPPQP